MEQQVDDFILFKYLVRLYNFIRDNKLVLPGGEYECSLAVLMIFKISPSRCVYGE
jgi:hypothetical protein